MAINIKEVSKDVLLKIIEDYKNGKVELHAKLCKDGQSLINCDYWLNLENCVEVNEE